MNDKITHGTLGWIFIWYSYVHAIYTWNLQFIHWCMNIGMLKVLLKWININIRLKIYYKRLHIWAKTDRTCTSENKSLSPFNTAIFITFILVIDLKGNYIGVTLYDNSEEHTFISYLAQKLHNYQTLWLSPSSHLHSTNVRKWIKLEETIKCGQLDVRLFYFSTNLYLTAHKLGR